MLNCVPLAARDEAQRIYMFERGLRQDIYPFVRFRRLQTLDASMEQALYVERRVVVMDERNTAPGGSSSVKRPTQDDGGHTSGQGPLRPPRFHPQGREFQGRLRSGGPQQQSRQQPRQQQH